jgi:outer membrane lipoprotein-sorting protein
MLRGFLISWAILLAGGGGLLASATPAQSGGRESEKRGSEAPEKQIDLGPIRQWVAKQSALQTVSARFVQTRSLRALKSPAAVPGQLWFRKPDGFRWELGEPAKSIMIRNGKALFLIRPQRMRAKKMTVEQLAEQTGLNGLAMMGFPMAKDFDDFKRQFDILEIEADERRCAFSAVPRDPSMKRFMRRVDVTFDRSDGALVEFSMTFRDGSSMSNRFSDVKMNGALASGLFEYDFTGYSFADAAD